MLDLQVLTHNSIIDTDRKCIRDLAMEYAEICQGTVQQDRRRLWRAKNNLQPVRPMIYARAFAWREMSASNLTCEHPVARGVENQIRHLLFWNSLDDDSIFEPWLTVGAVHSCTGWGVEVQRHTSGESGGSYRETPPLHSLDDVDKLRPPHHEIDEAATDERVELISDLVAGIIPVFVDRSPSYWGWSGDISTTAGHLRGIENLMLDMMDNPKGVHRLMRVLSDGVLSTHNQAEEVGDWSLGNHSNQAMPYAETLEDPAPDQYGVLRERLWGYAASQEFVLISPEMQDEFLLQYQLPILKKFGLTAYGCCEDLARKIDMLRQIPNLRRIAVSPFSDVAACVEKIRTDYVASYRPSPTDMVGYGYDEGRIRSILTADFAALRGTHFDITLKDVETVEADPGRVKRWIALTRTIIEEMSL